MPFAAGSAADLTTRGLGAKLQDILKQPVIVDDRPGASGPLGVSAALFKKVSYDPEKDFATIMRNVTGVNAVVVNDKGGTS